MSSFMEQEVETALKDISAGGALVETSKLYHVGDVLHLKIKIPGWEKYKAEFIRPGQLSRSEPLITLATIVRVELIRMGHYELGLCFVGIEESHQKALIRFLKKL